jgi:hypothetical protein
MGVATSGRLCVTHVLRFVAHVTAKLNQWLSLDCVNLRLHQAPVQIVDDVIHRYKEIVDMIWNVRPQVELVPA